ncbi:MAG TPA: sulfotransferase [Deltaproteobacteria bacterium]|nr:sulfotransferase [Deltaproteobacteria bacterium]
MPDPTPPPGHAPRSGDGTPPDPEASPIFVVGSSRSGTTLLRMMLSAHPRIHLTMEASFYLWGGTYTRWRDPDKFPPYYVRTFSFRWLRLDPGPVLQDLPRPFGFADRRRLYSAVMRQDAARHGKPRFGDKTPSHSASLGMIFADYPDARVIRMVRDPRDVIRSLLRMPWAPGSLTACAAMVELERRQAARFKDRILEVHLSELIEQPEETMRRILEHVGEPFCEEVLDHPRHAPDDLPPVPWFQAAARSAGRAAAPRRALDPVEIRVIEALSHRSLEALGLTPWPLPREPPWLTVRLRWLADLPRCLGAALIGLRLAWASRTGAAEGSRAGALLRRLNPGAWADAPELEIPDPPALPDGWGEGWPPLSRSR